MIHKEEIPDSMLFAGIHPEEKESILKCLSAVEKKYEKGDISLDISTFLELSKIFKVSPLAIIGDEIAEEEEECTYAETIEKL